jgi:hypothetical protein
LPYAPARNRQRLKKEDDQERRTGSIDIHYMSLSGARLCGVVVMVVLAVVVMRGESRGSNRGTNQNKQGDGK